MTVGMCSESLKISGFTSKIQGKKAYNTGGEKEREINRLSRIHHFELTKLSRTAGNIGGSIGKTNIGGNIGKTTQQH